MQLETAKGNEFNLKLSESQAEMLLMSAFQDYLIYATKIRIIGNAQIIPEDQNNASRLEDTGENIELFLTFTEENQLQMVSIYQSVIRNSSKQHSCLLPTLSWWRKPMSVALLTKRH
ncbi:hypothetical protein [Adlercreutzia agrestimuris]|uniref:hypothetical protein n=1 Tax=Adlercreutzia agrestimuris TaxID=2941324 RepID=UPI002040E6E1|nr:hypothetical protein [Adlercreutzia agrestimuris]